MNEIHHMKGQDEMSEVTNKKVFQILVDNNAGVLSRISGLFSRRGYNIESITAGVTAEPTITRITVEVRANADQRENVIALTNIFRGSIIDVSNESLMIEITGNSGKIDAFLKLVSGYEILELARTGVAGLGRGTKNVIYLDKLV